MSLFLALFIVSAGMSSAGAQPTSLPPAGTQPANLQPAPPVTTTHEPVTASPISTPQADSAEMDIDQFANQKDSIATLRDPFHMPVIQNLEDGSLKSPLELVPIDRMKVLGVITGPDQFRAMLQDPGGQTFLVSEKMKIGIRKGIIKKITSKGLWVQEKVLNVLGQEEVVDTVMKIEDIAKKAAGETSASDSGMSSSGG